MSQIVRRLVSLSASTTAVVEALDAADRLVAITKDCARLPPAVDGLPIVGDGWSVDADQVAGHEPDLVVGAAPFRGEVVAALVEKRLRFFATAPWTLAEIYRDIVALGALLDEKDRALALVKRMRDRVDEVRRRTWAADVGAGHRHHLQQVDSFRLC